MGDIPETEQYRPSWGRSLDLGRIDEAIRAANMGLMHRLTDMGRETISLDGHVSALLQKRLNRIGALDWTCRPPGR
jgi:phage gp29-like protein